MGPNIHIPGLQAKVAKLGTPIAHVWFESVIHQAFIYRFGWSQLISQTLQFQEQPQLKLALGSMLALVRGGCSAQLRKGLPVLLSPRQKLHCTAAATVEGSNCLLVSYPKLLQEALCVFFISEYQQYPLTHSVQHVY